MREAYNEAFVGTRGGQVDVVHFVRSVYLNVSYCASAQIVITLLVEFDALFDQVSTTDMHAHNTRNVPSLWHRSNPLCVSGRLCANQ